VHDLENNPRSSELPPFARICIRGGEYDPKIVNFTKFGNRNARIWQSFIDTVDRFVVVTPRSTLSLFC